MEYLVFAGALLLFLIIMLIKGVIDARNEKKRFIKSLYDDFGKLRKKEYPPGKMDTVTGYFKRHLPDYYLDDITWNDLDMDDIFKKLNHPYSSAGEEYLYYLLRTPSLDEDELQKREKYIRYFSENNDERVNLLYAISKIGFSGKYSIHDYIDNLDILGERKNYLHYLTWLLLAIGIGVCFANPGIGAVVIASVIIYNFTSYFREKKEIDPYITSFSYIMRILGAADAVEKLPHDVWNDEWKVINTAKKQLGRFRRGSYILMSSGRMSGSGSPLDMIFDYLRMMLHIDLIKFNNMLAEVRKHTKEFDEIVSAIGFLDAIIAVSAFRAGREDACVPDVADKLSVTDAVHPLIEGAVPNGIDASKGVLLTGSNASGKSTFLKTVAINAILSQTIHTATAKSYAAPLYRIATSMALKDNLFENESYYIVEIKSIKRILDMAKEGIPVLCFVDEVLRGTNTVERISASTQILKDLAKHDVTCFAATHDIELADLLAKYYDNYHFEEEIVDGDVKFSYMIKDGKATTRNDIKLLEVMGYDASLVKSAEEMSKAFLENGTWDKVSYE